MRYHKGNDIRIITKVSGFTFDEVANFFVLIEHENGHVVKQFAVNAAADFNTTDRTVIDNTTVEVRLLAHETADYSLGMYVARLMVAYSDAAFENAVRLESDSQLGFHLVSDIEPTDLVDRALTFYGYEVSGDGSTETSASIKSKYESNADTNAFTDAEKTKLANTEDGAQVNPSAAAIKSDYESNANTNAYTDAEKAKLAGLEAPKWKGSFTTLTALEAAYPAGEAGWEADVDAGVGSDVVRYIWDNNDSKWLSQLGTSTAETAASIKSKYESNADTNAFTDAEKTKLSNVEAGANNYTHPSSHAAGMITEEADRHFMLDAERAKLGSIEENANNYAHPSSHPASIIVQDANNRFSTDVEKAKLAGIEAGAQVNPTNAAIKTAYEANANTNAFTDAEKAKLANTEDGAQVNPSAAAIKSDYESNANTNAYTDAEKAKLAGLEAPKWKGSFTTLAALEAAYPAGEAGWEADVDGGAGSDVVRYIWDDNDNKWVQQLGISTAETAASIKSKYESNADTNAFTDALLSKLNEAYGWGDHANLYAALNHNHDYLPLTGGTVNGDIALVGKINETSDIINEAQIFSAKPQVSGFYGNELWMADKFATVTYSSNITNGYQVFRTGDSISWFEDGSPAVYEITGLNAIPTTAVVNRKLVVFFHYTYSGNVKIEALTAEDVWVTLVDEVVNVERRTWFHWPAFNAALNPYPAAWPLKGLRFTFSDYGASRMYLRQLGLTNTQDYQMFEYVGRQGGNVYAPIISTSDIHADTFYEGGQSLALKYLPKTGGVVSGDLIIKGDTGAAYGHLLYQYSADGLKHVRTYVNNDGTYNLGGADRLSISSTSGDITFNAGLYINLRSAANQNMYLNAGGEFIFRDVDNSNATTLTIDSATGNLSTIGTISEGGTLLSDKYAAKQRPIKSVTDAAYIFILTDKAKYVRGDNASAQTFTVPTNASVAFAIGDEIHVRQAGAGQITFVGASGVTVNTSETLKLRGQHSTATLIKVAADEWDLIGDLETA